jgi:hypothetical protein
MRRVLFVALLLLMIGLQPASALAGPTLDFAIGAPTPGTISYAGGTAPLVGVGIAVDSISGVGTSTNAGIAATCLSCVLSFTTGNLIGNSATSWEFAAGGTIAVTGGVDLPGTTSDIPLSTVLLSGVFSDIVKVQDLGGGVLSMKLLAAAVQDKLSSPLSGFWGLPDVLYIGALNLSFSAPGSAPNAFASAPIFSGDLGNNPGSTAPVVPEPGTLLLIGSGLAGLAVTRARRRRQR